MRMTDYFVDITIWSVKDITEIADELGCGIDLRDLHKGYVIITNTTFGLLSRKLTNLYFKERGPNINDVVKPTKPTNCT